MLIHYIGDGDLCGIYLFDFQSKEEAQQLTGIDPEIQSGNLTLESKEWQGSEALNGVESHSLGSISDQEFNLG